MNVKSFLKRSSPTILAFAGMTGVVGSIVLASIASPKADKEIRKLKKTNEDATKFDIFKVAAPYYIPTVIAGTTTMIS